ncbi:hypothetical protein QF015_002380 [Paenarthrobacter sp. TE4293]|uniref:P-loop NTPase n=1 Tax=Paenarthrobacter sp. TE4293 TaxID=3381695 RepID=UPI003D1FD8E1
MTDYMEQAVDRLSYAIKEEADRRIVFLTGSGISLPQVPSTAAMVEIFFDELGASAKALRVKLQDQTAEQKYLAVSHELKQRRGDRGLAAAIRKGVLKAIKDSAKSKITSSGGVDDEDWELPRAQERLGQLVAAIPRQQVGAILTTNFDSLSEVACRIHSIQTVTVAVAGKAAFQLDALYGTLPIVHLHGFWESSATLSTGQQLATERPQVEQMIARVLEKSLLVVVGYGGWEDSFTRALISMMKDGRLSSLETEVVWLQFGGAETKSAHPILTAIDGAAGVSIYYGIDAEEFFTSVLSSIGTVGRVDREVPMGWSVPVDDTDHLGRDDLLNYVQGTQPTWPTAALMPRLHNTKKAAALLNGRVDESRSGLIVLAAPAGEGKSTALRQLALDASENYPEAVILHRNPGAPRVTPAWIQYLRENNALTLIFVDDADLVLGQIVDSGGLNSVASGGVIIWIAALHSSYLYSGAMRRARLSDIDVLEFEQFGRSDSELLSEVWLVQDVVPTVLRGRSSDDITNAIEKAGSSQHGGSLFGSVLQLWSGDGLLDRVSELMAKVAKLTIRGVSFRYLLSAVAVTQVAWDREEEFGGGISLSVLGQMADIRSTDVLRMVVEPLGREIGISRIGDKVYVRHPSIADAIVQILKKEDELPDVARSIAKAGAQLRFSREYEHDEYRAAYMLSRRLTGAAARAAGRGAIDGGPSYLEPRVSMLTTMRENGELATARRYAQELSTKLGGYSDALKSQRGFFVEWSVVEARAGNFEKAMSLAVRSLSDQVDGFLRLDKLLYSLDCIRAYAGKRELENKAGAAELKVAASHLLNNLPAAGTFSTVRNAPRERRSLFEVQKAFRIAALKFVDADTTFRKMQEVVRVNSR